MYTNDINMQIDSYLFANKLSISSVNLQNMFDVSFNIQLQIYAILPNIYGYSCSKAWSLGPIENMNVDAY